MRLPTIKSPPAGTSAAGGRGYDQIIRLRILPSPSRLNFVNLLRPWWLSATKVATAETFGSLDDAGPPGSAATRAGRSTPRSGAMAIPSPGRSVVFIGSC